MTIEELENLRKKARNRVLLGILVSAIVIFCLLLITQSSRLLFVGIVAGFIFTQAISSKPKRDFILEYKKVFVQRSLQTVFTDLIYMPDEGISESIIRDTRMMNMGDRYSSNDYIQAKYKGINVMQADVHIEEEHQTTDSNGNTTTTWVTIFKGRWMVFDFNKNFKANIQVCQSGFGNAKISNWGSDLKFQKVMMEDELFNKNYKVYAQNEHDAFYILTPSLMEKIKRLTNSIQGKLLFCFIDNKLHVGVYNGKDSFEHSIFTKIDEPKVLEEVSRDIKLITNFIDELNLDNDLFRREV